MLRRTLVLLLLCVPALAQMPRIHAGATIYIEPADGYETYLAAAFAKKSVPLTIVLDKSKADYNLISTVNEKTYNQPAVIINNTNGDDNTSPTAAPHLPWGRSTVGSTSVSMSVVDTHSSAVVFAYSVGKARDTNQLQSAAEACAKHLKEFIEKIPK